MVHTLTRELIGGELVAVLAGTTEGSEQVEASLAAPVVRLRLAFVMVWKQRALDPPPQKTVLERRRETKTDVNERLRAGGAFERRTDAGVQLGIEHVTRVADVNERLRAWDLRGVPTQVFSSGSST